MTTTRAHLTSEGVMLDNLDSGSTVTHFHGHHSLTSGLETHMIGSSIAPASSADKVKAFHFVELVVDTDTHSNSKVRFGSTASSTSDTDYIAVGVEIVGGLLSGTPIGTLTLADGSITDSSGAISFGNENLSTTGTLASGNLSVTGTIAASNTASLATGSTIGNLTLANGSITDSSGAISFGNEDLSTTGTLGCGVLTAASGSAVGNLTLANGSITDSSGAISFGNENLSTNGTLGCGNLSVTGTIAASSTASLATGSTIGNLTLANGSITDSSGAISFDNENLTTTGTMTASAHTASSDRRIKENIQEHDPQETHTNVMKLKGVDYNLIADENKSKNTGFVAQEVEEVFPQFVKEDSDGMKSVNYSQMTAVLLSALQHQNSLIETLTARVAALESA